MTPRRLALLAGANLRPVFYESKISAPPTTSFTVGIGETVDLGDGNVAVGIADASMEHGIRIEVRSKE